MPPKATTQASKSTKKNDKKSAVPEVKLDDFFTRFLAKKRRNLNKKLTKIETYEKTPSDKLQPDHKEIIESKPDTLERLEYFETIGKLYIEAYLSKDDEDEGAPAQSPQRQEEPKAAAAAPVAAVNHEETNARIAASLAQLLTASSFFAHTQQRESFAKTHGAALSKKYGANFLEGLGNLWRTLSEHHDSENSARVEQVTKIIENFLNNSALISPATNTTYQRLHEAIRELGSHQAFLGAVHSKGAVHVHHEEVHEPQSEVKTEIKMVKSSRKNSKRSRIQSEVVPEPVAHPAEPTPAAPAKPTKPAKEVDPDAPQEDDEWFSAAGRNNRGRGAGRGRGRGNGRGGRDGPRREDGGNPRPRTERREDRDEKTEGGEPRERRPRGGRGSADGERRQFRPEGDRPFRGDGERRGRGARRGDGERRPRGDRGTAQNEGANQETN